jgi:hypothetical protein
MMKLFHSRLKSTSVKNTAFYRSSTIIGVTLSALYLTACSDNNDASDIDAVEKVDSAFGIWFGEATTILTQGAIRLRKSNQSVHNLDVEGRKR